jgi:hypothetical protein
MKLELVCMRAPLGVKIVHEANHHAIAPAHAEAGEGSGRGCSTVLLVLDSEFMAFPRKYL